MQELSEHSSFSQRMKYFMKSKRITAENIADKLGVTKGAVTHWSNEIRFPKSDIIDEIADALDENVVDLFPSSKKNRHEIVKQELSTNLDEYLDHIPTVALPSSVKHITVTKGYPQDTKCNNIIQEQSMHYVTKIYIDKRMVKTAYQDKELQAVVMMGDSMTPYLAHDDIAIYHPTPTPVGDGRYVINTPHGLTIKKLKFNSNGSVLLISENSDYNTMGTYDEEFTAEHADTLEVLGLVVGRILKN